MPRLKEVESLQEMARRLLLSSIVQCFQKLSETSEGALVELREAVNAVKQQILTRIPRNMLADFIASFINDCDSFVRDEIDGRAVLELIMDIEIVGLRLTGPIVRFLKPYDAPRLRKLTELHLYDGRDGDNDGHEAPPNMKIWKFRLPDLTSLKYSRYCTDFDLEIIARHCSNLEVLDLHASKKVTDEGLRHLSACPNLRVVKLHRCPNVTHVGLSFLLSQCRKLEEFSYGYLAHDEADIRCWDEHDWSWNATPPEFDMLSGLDFTVQCPALTNFVYETNQRFHPPARLRSIVTKFPNLTSLTINCIEAENLSTIQDLHELRKLRVNLIDGLTTDSIRQTWQGLREALTVIGANLTSLSLRVNLRQFDVNSIFDACPNLEQFQFDVGEYNSESLEIPSFQKLRELIVRIQARMWIQARYRARYPTNKPILKFGVMSNLESLSLININADFESLESMMLDNIHFPKLRVVRTNLAKSECLTKIQQIATDNNINFCVENCRILNQCNDDKLIRLLRQVEAQCSALSTARRWLLLQAVNTVNE